VEYDGRAKNLEGRANMVELEVDGPTHIEALNLRLYNPETHKWSLNFASSKAGTLGTPTVGEFKKRSGRIFRSGGFQRTHSPRALHHLGHQNQNPASSSNRSRQTVATTWEANWIAIDTRVNK